jgi:hypothetical protein
MPTSTRAHRIDVVCVRYGAKGGIYGRLEMWRPGKPTWDLAVDIEVGAGLTVRETETHGPRIVPERHPMTRGLAISADHGAVAGGGSREVNRPFFSIPAHSYSQALGMKYDFRENDEFPCCRDPVKSPMSAASK